MCEKRLKTSEKLRMLAPVVARNRRFELMNPNHCTVAIGLRLDLNTGAVLRKQVVSEADRYSGKAHETKPLFAQKFGMSANDAMYLWVGRDSDGEKIVPNGVTRSQQAKAAAVLLERYAQQYEAQGN